MGNQLIVIEIHRRHISTNSSELSAPIQAITDIYREVNDPYQPEEGCPCQLNRSVRSCLFREFPVVDKRAT